MKRSAEKGNFHRRFSMPFTLVSSHSLAIFLIGSPMLNNFHASRTRSNPGQALNIEEAEKNVGLHVDEEAERYLLETVPEGDHHRLTLLQLDGEKLQDSGRLGLPRLLNSGS